MNHRADAIACLLVLVACNGNRAASDLPIDISEATGDATADCRPATSPSCTFESNPCDCSLAFFLNHSPISGETPRAKCFAICAGEASLTGEYGLNGNWCDASCGACIGVSGMTCDACCLLSDEEPAGNLCAQIRGDGDSGPSNDLPLDLPDESPRSDAWVSPDYVCPPSMPVSVGMETCYPCEIDSECRICRFEGNCSDRVCISGACSSPSCPAGLYRCASGECRTCCEDVDCGMGAAGIRKCLPWGTCDGRWACPQTVSCCQGQCISEFPVCAIINNIARCVECSSWEDLCSERGLACHCDGENNVCVDEAGQACPYLGATDP